MRAVLGPAPSAADPAALATTAEQLCTGAATTLARWVGLEGAFMLIERALVTAREERPWLAGVSVEARNSPHLPGLEAAIAGLPTDEVVEALVAVFADVVTMLGRFVGDDVACKLAEEAWPPRIDSSSQEPS